MRRLFWLGVGLAVGAIVVRKATKKAEAYTPKGLATSVQASATGLLDSLRDLVDDIREHMAEREAELLGALAGDGDVSVLLTGDEPRDDKGFDRDPHG